MSLFLPQRPDRDWKANINLTLAPTDRVQNSPYGHSQGEELSVAKWMADVSFPPLIGADRREFDAWLSKACRASRTILVEAPFAAAGSFDDAEIITNGHLYSDVTSWVAASATVTRNSRKIKVENSGAASGRAGQDVTLVAGKKYALRAAMHRGKVENFKVECYDNDAPGSLASVTATEEGDTIVLLEPVNTSHNVRLHCNTSVAADYALYSRISLTRCLLVNGASQTGSAINVDGFDSGDGILLSGDYVEIQTGTGTSELKRLAADLDDDGLMQFEPPIGTSPADNAIIVVNKPCFRGFFPDPKASALYTPPDFSGVAISIEERP